MDKNDAGQPLDLDTEQLRVRVVRPDIHRPAVRLVVVGEVDGLAAPPLIELVTAAQAHWRPPAVELDLAGVSFLDSGGIRCLVDCLAVVDSAGSTLTVVNPMPGVRRILEIVGLLETFGLPSVSRRAPGRRLFTSS